MANLKFLRYKTTSEFNTAKTNKSFKQGDIVFDSEAKILYIVTDDTPTLEPYYGNNAIKDVSCSGATITVTLSDGSTKSITVNNVASAGTATNATNDSDGNKINTTYFKKSGGTIDGATTINGGLTATGETDVESLTADSLIVNGSTRFNNNVTADTFTGNLKGNADTATSASTAGTASKLSTNAGSATQPIYFKDGVPTAITGPIANNTTGKASTAGTADYATKLGNSTNSYTYSDVTNQFAALTTADTNLSNRIGDSELAIGNKLSEIENNINDITDWQQKPTADEIITNRLGVLESINIGGTILDKTEYQGNAKTATTASSAASASKLTTPKTIGISTGATGTATSFDGTSNITIPITAVKEGYLTWGGKSISGDISPVGMAISAEHSANRLALIKGDALTFEYSSDAGSTWTDYGYSADDKSWFCTNSFSVPIGRANSSEAYTTNSRTRITLSAQGYVYTNPRKLLINISSSGGMNVLIEYKTGVTDAEWKEFGTYAVSGWSGWNDIPLILGTLGGGSTQSSNIWYLRLTFIMTSVSTSYNTSAGLYGIRLFGTNNWSTASSIAGKGPISSTGHLYTYDVNANATFPNAVIAKFFSGDLTGNATTATTATTATKAKTIITEVGTTNVNRPVFFAYNGDTTKVVYDNDFVYNPATNTLTIGTGTLTGTNYSGNAAKATSAATAGVASKTQAALTFGSQTFDGSSAKTITAADLGLSSALKFLGTTTTALSDAATTNPITINGANVTAQIGNVVLYGHLEFLWNGSKWEELGDEQSFALKSVQINAGNGLTGGGTLEATRTISHADTSSQASVTTGGRTYINSITLDGYGHVTGLGTGTETDQTTVSSIPWTGITGKPTTLSGYGITDGVPTYTVNVAQTDLTWIKAVAAKKANRMSFYYNHNGSEWSYLLGCRNIDADDSLTYGSILKFGYTDTYLRILRITSGSWQSSDWEKISAGYADTSGSCSGNAATATTATTATSTSGLICSDVRDADRSPDTYFTAKRVSALFNNSISGANSVWNSAIHVHGWTSGYVAWELIGPASDSIGSDNLYWREGINSTWQPVRKILDSSNYNNYAPTLTGTGASGTWGISISGNASTSSACSGNSATATVANSAIGPDVWVDDRTLINAGFLASDYTSRYDTVEFLKAFVKWAQTNYSGRSIFGILNPNSRGYFFIDCYSSGFNSSTGYPEHCTGRYYPHSGNSYIFGTSYGSWYCYDGISSANIASQSVKYATSAGTATSCSGNSATTTKLATAVNINGTSFNGASSITTANWGTARNITITDGTNTGAAVSVNGSAAVSLKLPTTISANFKGGTISGTTGTFSSSLSVTGDIAANSNVNVTNQTKSKTFNIDGGCTLEYDSTNKCVKFVF